MIRLAIGFLLGLSIGTASADSMLGKDSIKHHLVEFQSLLAPTLNAGTGPDGQAAPIRVDENGYVICSDKGPRR